MNIPRLTTATSGLASEAVLQIAAPFHQYRTPQCTEPVKAQPSADRSTEMNEYTRETEKPANEGKTLTLPSRLIEAAEFNCDPLSHSLTHLGCRIEKTFALRVPYAHGIHVNDLFVGFKKIHQQSRRQQFKGANDVGFVVRARHSLAQRLRTHPVAEFGHHVRLLQVMPHKTLHLVHEGDPDSL